MSFEIDSDESSPNILYEIISGGAGSSSARINFSTNNEDWFGQENFTITLDDGVSGSVNQSFPVLVNNINDGPTISNIDNQLIDEDTTLNLLISTQDIDSENLSLSASSDHLSFEFYGDSLEITPSKHYNGDNYRIMVINNEVIGIVKRDNPYVLGDGNSTLLKLITEHKQSKHIDTRNQHQNENIFRINNYTIIIKFYEKN